MEHLDVLVVGAGLSGIGAGHYLQTECPWASYAIFEGARRRIGGTWDLFRYPGVRSDSDMYTLGYPFRPWTGQQAIADGASILQYIEDTAAAEGIDAQDPLPATASSPPTGRPTTARWHVTAERTDTGETVALTCRSCSRAAATTATTTATSRTSPALDRFAGRIVHPQAWPDDLDCTGRAGGGDRQRGTAVTIVPALAPSRRPRHDGAALAVVRPDRADQDTARPASFARVVPERWPGRRSSWTFATMTQGFYKLSRRRPDLVKRMLRKGTAKQLPAGLRHRHPLHAALRALGRADVHLARRRSVPRHPVGPGRHRHRPHRHLHRAGHPPRVGPRARCRRHRHGDGARAAVRRRRATQRRRRHGRRRRRG